MNSQPVLRTDEGIVLMSSGGRIIKAAYDFGNSLKNINQNYPIVLSNLNLPIINTSIGYWMKKNTTGIAMYADCSFIKMNYNNNSVAHISHRTGDQSTLFYPRVGGSTTIVLYDKPDSFRVLYFNSPNLVTLQHVDMYNSYNNYRETTKDVTSDTDNSTATQINTLTISPYVANTGASYTNRTYDDFYIFTRKISLDEVKYIYANGNGSEPQSTLGMYLWFKFERAEILDFSAYQDGSSMKVGVRDYSGNFRHGEITQLPAGTLDQKLTFANANMFQNG